MKNNLEKKFRNIVKGARKNALSLEEKEGIRSQLLYFIEDNPHAIDSEHLPAKYFYQNINWLFSSFVDNIVRPMNNNPVLKYATLVLAVLFIGGISISVGAENALPGDTLYPIKTNVSEKVVALTLFSDQAKAEYDINLAQLRLEEAETMAAQNKLNGQSSQEVTILLVDHLKDIENRILDIKSKENARVAAQMASKLQVAVQAHAPIVDKLIESAQGNGSDIKNILSEIEKAIENR